MGLKRLDKGLAAMPEVSAEKEWHAYLLDWNAPPYGEKLPWRLHGSTCLCAWVAAGMSRLALLLLATLPQARIPLSITSESALAAARCWLDVT